MSGILLRVRGLHFAFPGDEPLFEGWSIDLPAGLCWLSGESGSGKTTLLRLLAGALPCHGERLLDGLDFDADPAAWRSRVVFVDAGDPAWDGLRPAELRDAVWAGHPQADAAAWQRHIDGFGLAPHRDKTLHMLSTGMRRKAVLAAVLASGATLSLLDEPLAGLDAPSAAYLVQALNAWAGAARRLTLLACGTWPAGLAQAVAIALPER